MFKDSFPPLRIATFPDFIDRHAISIVTFGLLSYIAAITPIGTGCFFITKPSFLVNSSLLRRGSFSFLILFIEVIIFLNFLGFKINLSLISIGNLVLLARSFLLALRIRLSWLFKFSDMSFSI